MKKQLLTSTALVAAGAMAFAAPALAKNPALTLGGSTEQIVGFSDNDNASSYTGGGNGFDQQTDSEIHFNASTTLDNGIKIRARIELEGNTSADQIDEHWMRISGSFGQVTLGSQDGASQLMVTGYQGSWAAGVGQNLAFDVADWVEAPSTAGEPSTVQRVTLDGDSEKISYYTPRFAGFQLGASYVPHNNDDTNNTPAGRDTEDHEGFQFGISFDRKFDGIGIGAAVGYADMQQANSALDKKEVFGGGLRVDFAGFRVGVGYVQNTTPTSAVAETETTAYDFGVRYSFGPNAVSLTYMNAEADTGVAGSTNGETSLGMVSYRRTLGPGVNWTLNGMWADYQGTNNTATSDDNEGYALTTSIKVRF